MARVEFHEPDMVLHGDGTKDCRPHAIATGSHLSA
jgi:hypothetical protein